MAVLEPEAEVEDMEAADWAATDRALITYSEMEREIPRNICEGGGGPDGRAKLKWSGGSGRPRGAASGSRLRKTRSRRLFMAKSTTVLGSTPLSHFLRLRLQSRVTCPDHHLVKRPEIGEEGTAKRIHPVTVNSSSERAKETEDAFARLGESAESWFPPPQTLFSLTRGTRNSELWAHCKGQM